MASVRGMGVALIMSMCGSIATTGPHAPPLRGSLPPEGAASPWGGPAATPAASFCRSASRCATPKRCCSSMMASARFLNCTCSWMTAWVPTTRAASPLATSASMAVRSFFFCPPTSQATRRPRAASRGSSQPIILAKCCSARISVGAISAHCQPASMARHAARAETTVLPEPTSPCSRRCMGTARARSAAISSPTRRWAEVRLKGSTASNCSCSGKAPSAAFWARNTGARSMSRARRDCCCDSCWASSSSAFRRCHAGWLWSSSVDSATSGVGWCKKVSASRMLNKRCRPFWL